MTSFDLFVIAILITSLVVGLWRGLVYEVLSLLGWPVAYFISKSFAGSIAPLMPITQDTTRIVVAYVVLFVIGLIAWSLLVFVLNKLMKAIGLGGLDTLLGSVFGLLRGAMIIIALVSLGGLTEIPKQPFWQQAKTSKAAEEFAQMAKTFMPPSISARIQFPSRS